MNLAEIRLWLVEQIAEATSVSLEDVPMDEPFLHLGLDSLKAVQITGKIEEKLQRVCSPTLFYDYPTIEQLAHYLHEGTHSAGPALQAKGAALGNAGETEDIAIVGISCRFPGAESPAQFWENLLNGRQSISEIPDSRWNLAEYYSDNPDEKGKMYARWGGFLERVREFDAGFFGISPLEAEVMDPQQRLLMEQSWLAFEDAGIRPSELENSDVGVFVGISTNDYSKLKQLPEQITAYHGTGNAFSIAANRLSYFYNFTGPSLSLDTACSSSLVALHQACRSLKEGESSLALVGGVNLILDPDLYINFSKARMMSESGRCHTFDERADGYVRGEGCGMVVLRRLSEALANGDRIYAVVKGSAVNQDGRSNGLTAPRGTSQKSVVERALSKAGLGVNDIGYVEAHGTGTKLGDPIEINALKEVFANKQEGITRVGAVKANIGHLEAGAGIASVIKVCLMFRHGIIPRHPDLQKMNEHITLEGTTLAIPVEAEEWKDKMKNAGISSFGFGGTNAHVILQSYRAPKRLGARRQLYPGHILTLSAKSEPSLRRMQDAYVHLLENAPVPLDLHNLCYTAHCRRDVFPYRIHVDGRSREELASKLRSAAGQAVSRVPGKIAFVYGGQGSQYPGMARELFHTSPVFQQALSSALSCLDEATSDKVMQILYGSDGALSEAIHETEYTQLTLFLIQYALSQLWSSFGIKPDYVAGHSIGEYAAACQAGMLELSEAVELVRIRGQLMGSTPLQGEMATVQSNESAVRHWMEKSGLGLSVAAVNSPGQTVVSGTAEDLAEFTAILLEQNIPYKKLAVSNAFHSSLMEPVLNEFHQAASTVHYYEGHIPLISNLDGQPRRAISADYLRDHLRGTVRFHDCMTYFREMKVTVIEIGPGGLIKMARRYVNGDLAWGASLNKDGADWEVIHHSLTLLAERGSDVDWKGYYAPLKPELAELPSYEFNRRQYWLKEAPPVEEYASTVDDFNLPVVLEIIEHQLETINNQSTYMLKRG
ncbi:beta-ketoacyl synthase N-terminal-like domain-containing protein [Paenibacillus sp. NPDC057934]|uniref:type I polyketide synthase n=1 Tax=Paenibacillus sp. NPDC057934 TaxID=3346282 RepID=UPI0036DBD6EB